MIYKVFGSIFLLFIVLNFKTQAHVHQERINSLIHDIRHTTHLALSDDRINIDLFSIKDPDYFFISNFRLGRALWGERQYHIGFNPLVFKENIPEEALKAILAHELMHTQDYATGTTLGKLIPIGLKVVNRLSRIQYERKTDLRTVLAGYSQGLKLYREWQYKLLSPKALKIKKQEYLTPDEIDFINTKIRTNPDYKEAWLKKVIPMNLKQFKIYDWYKKNGEKYFSPKQPASGSYHVKLNNLNDGEYHIIPISKSGDLKFYKEYTRKLKEGELMTKNHRRNVYGLLLYSKDLITKKIIIL